MKEKKKPMLTIGITSYNRIEALSRCLQSIKTNYSGEIEVLVSEDRSPKREQIRIIVESYANYANYTVRFHSNKQNLGYDRNLKKIVCLANGKYVLLMSDDDYLLPGSIDKILSVIKKKQPGVLYAPFTYEDTESKGRMYIKSCIIPKSPRYAAKHIYDSILFSGLVFRKELVAKLDAEPFLNKNYFQVYMFLYTISFFGGYYMNMPTIQCVGDGENAYGRSDSSDQNPLLADRNSVYSNLEFHKGLIYTIRKFDKDFNLRTFHIFQKEYNLRSITGLIRAEANGKRTLKIYWKRLNTLDIKISMNAKIYYGMLLVLGEKKSAKILNVPAVILKCIRHEVL